MTSNRKRKICVITGTRAEYGLLRWVIQGIQESNNLELQLIVTGMHLSPEFGLTYKEIQQDGYPIKKKVEMLLSSDTTSGIIKSMGLGIISFADAFDELRPDLIVVLGDRYEIFSATSAAMIARIPIGHIHGGEATEGLIDESIRHSITKMSHLHFVATEEYKNRVTQLGETPKNIFNVGGLGIDSINRLDLLEKKELEDEINFKFGVKNLMITFHPVTLEENTSSDQMKELLSALESMHDTKLIFTMPNADTDGRVLFDIINDFVIQNPNAKSYISLGQLKYLSCLKYVDGVVGNSSSGIIEAPSFNIGTINIGDRQRGRVKAESIIDVVPKREKIRIAIKKLFSNSFRKSLLSINNPYGNSTGASDEIVNVLEKISFKDILKKEFYDLVVK